LGDAQKKFGGALPPNASSWLRAWAQCKIYARGPCERWCSEVIVFSQPCYAFLMKIF